MKRIVSVQNVSYQYNKDSEEWALQQISFDVHEGEWLALVGHNGSGKSTAARLLNGLLLPDVGRILVGDSTQLQEDTIWDVRKQIGMVFQNPENQFVGTTVRDDVAFGLENLGLERSEINRRIEEYLKLVGMMDFINNEPHHLSGGQKQRVAIASVLAMQPSLLVLDESTAMLDPIGRKQVMNIVRNLQKDKRTSILSITHDLEEVLLADRIIVLNDGKIFAEGTPEEIFGLDKELIAIGLDLPFAVHVSKLLREKGIALPKNFLTHEELVEELWTLYSTT